MLELASDDRECGSDNLGGPLGFISARKALGHLTFGGYYAGLYGERDDHHSTYLWLRFGEELGRDDRELVPLLGLS